MTARGLTVELFDKGRSPGGRLSTRRAQTPLGEVRFDHGAQYVTAKGASFSAFLNTAAHSGAAALWEGRVVSIDRGGNIDPLRDTERWVGAPAMNALVKAALDGQTVNFARRARKVTGGPGEWRVHFEDGDTQGPYTQIALTLPPEQLIEFLALSDGEFSDMIAEARSARLSPCWAVMCVPDADCDLGFDGAKLLGGALRWMARMNSRPQRNGPEGWVLHASPDWSEAFVDMAPETVAQQLTEEAFVRFGLPQPQFSQAHRWLYAMVADAPGTDCALDASGTLGCAGDWRLGPRAECGWDSGAALGAALAG